MPSAKTILADQLAYLEGQGIAYQQEIVGELRGNLEREEAKLAEVLKTAEDIRYTLEALGEL